MKKKFHFKLNRYEGTGGVSDQALVTITTLPTNGSLPVHKKAKAIRNNADAMNALCQAVANWVAKTEDGKELWDETCSDLNIADLQDLNEVDSFVDALTNEGIDDLEINIDNVFETLDDFTFDTVLPIRAKDFVDPL